jgi:transcriptional regulator with XRE-family HTH domain
MNSYPEFASRLNQLLRDLDRPAAWLANRLGVSTSTVTRWLNGQTRPGQPETVIRLADILGVHDVVERQALLAAVGYGYQAAGEASSPSAYSDRVDKNRSVPRQPGSPNRRTIDLPGTDHLERPKQNWGEAPDVTIFYGREAEIARLEAWLLRDRCRLVGVLGIGGIGKTALVTRLAQQVQDQFEYLVWSSLRNAPSLEEMLADWILFLSDQQHYDLPVNVGQRISRLMDYLRQQRCLLILFKLRRTS